MAKRITPLDVQAYTTRDVFEKGERVFNDGLVKYRFQTNYGLHVTVRDKKRLRVEMIVSGEQIFGRCNCSSGNRACEHQVAALLAWIHEPATFINYDTLRKAIRRKDKTTLVDTLMNLTDVFPEISQFFVTLPGLDDLKAIRNEVGYVFDYPRSHKVLPADIIDPCQILFVHAHMFRNDGNWQSARILLFEILNRTLDLVDHRRIADPFPENFVTELSDEYEEVALNDPLFDENKDQILDEVSAILDHDSADIEGVYLEQLRERLELEDSI